MSEDKTKNDNNLNIVQPISFGFIIILILALYFLPAWCGIEPAGSTSLYFLVVPLLLVGTISYLFYLTRQNFRYEYKRLEIQKQKEQQETERQKQRIDDAENRRKYESRQQKIENLFRLIELLTLEEQSVGKTTDEKGNFVETVLDKKEELHIENFDQFVKLFKEYDKIIDDLKEEEPDDE